MPELLELLRRPDIAELLEQMGELLDRRLRHIAAKAASRAMDTLEQVQTEGAQASTSTPISPEAIQTDRRAATSRNQRRLAASAALAHHRALRTPPKPIRFPKQQATAADRADSTDLVLDRGGMATQRVAMQDAATQPLQQTA
jgi:hypothetical protein